MASTMVAEERRSRLLELVRQKGFASLPDLAGELQVSESTVRRDLDYLEEIGEAQRTHGGVFYTGPSPKLPHFDSRQVSQWDKKRRIAESAAALIEDGDTVLLDGGSTTYELARRLVGRPLQVVTNSLPVANLFASSDTADLIIIGGYVHPRSGVTLGPYATQMVNALNVRRAVVSVAGINERGYYNSNLLVVEMEQAMMKTADEVIVVADSTKFGQSSLARVCGLGDVGVLVVDHEISEHWRNKISEAGVRLIVAEPASQNENGTPQADT